jgi:hypothetical protein
MSAVALLATNAHPKDADIDAAMSGNRVLRAAAPVLALCVLPLTAFAAISLGTRVAQHGLSPERLWGLVAIGVACAFGLAWLVAVLRGWKGGGWRTRLRQANLHLAAATTLVALLLALPILDFGAISARHQVARLESRKVSSKDFDYSALRWDFGDAGRRALAELAKQPGDSGTRAALALAQNVRTYGVGRGTRIDSDFNLRVQPENPALRKLVLRYLELNPYLCGEYCVAIDLGGSGKQRSVALVTDSSVNAVTLDAGTAESIVSEPSQVPELTPGSTVEVRKVERRYVFVDGKPLGPPLDDK